MSEMGSGQEPARPKVPVARKRSAMPRSFHFSMGEALSRTLACYGKNLPFLLIIGLVLFAPLVVLQVGAAEKAWAKLEGTPLEDEYGALEDDFYTESEKAAGPGIDFLASMLPWFIQALVTLGVFQFLRGERMQVGRSIGRGMGRFFPVLGIAIMTGLLMVLAMIPAGILIAAVAMGGGMIGVVIAGLLGAGVMLAVMCIFFVSVQATIVERVGPVMAMSRSAALTKGARWKIFGVILIFFVGGLVLQMLAQGVLGGTNPESWSQARTGLIASLVVGSIFAVLQAVAATVVYHDLRRAKEGVDLDELMSVFA